MRVISGERRGLQLKSLKGDTTRPTSDKVKESLFNRIGPYFNGGTVVELFGGSGALSIEALSRGMTQAYIFEKDRAAYTVIQSNIEKCHYEDRAVVFQADAKTASSRLQQVKGEIDLLIIDPPYAKQQYYELVAELAEAGYLSEQAIIVCEHNTNMILPTAYDEYIKNKEARYGQTILSIYEK